MGLIMKNGISYGGDSGGSTSHASAVEYTKEDGAKSAVQNELDELNTNLDSCFQSVSDGKELLASAVTDKGVTTASDATFKTIATNIGKIKDVANNTAGTATAAAIESGKTAWVNDVKVTGTRPAPVTAQSGSVTFMVAAAGHSGDTVYPQTTTHLVTFSKAFDKVPTVSVVATSLQQYLTVTASSINQSSFIINAKNSLVGSNNVTFNWSAQA